jgi:succinate dehydrogenase / fumarate reductase iron-sulfur subunit
MEVTFKVHRYDPATDDKGQSQAYTLDIEENATVLDALMSIREEQDSTLAFRGSCRTGFCGDCTMRVSRSNCISCMTTVGSVVKDGEITVEPIRLIKPAKDMMYDVEEMVYKKYRSVDPWIEPIGPQQPHLKEHQLNNEEVQRLRKAMSCTMCWLCDEGCSTMVVDRKFVGPAALTKAYRSVFDPRDGRTEERLHKLSEDHGLWDCCHCFEASEHCPKGIGPTERIFDLRDKAIKAGAGNSTVKNHYTSFAASVKKDGWLDEGRLAIETEGLMNVKGQLKQLPLGLKALRKGKMPKPYLLHEKREGADRIGRIFDKWEAKK